MISRRVDPTQEHNALFESLRCTCSNLEMGCCTLETKQERHV
jgi:hypothetical protein